MMRPFTERLLQVAAMVALLWFGWQLAASTVVDLIVAKQRLAACEARAVPQPIAPQKGPAGG